MSSREEMTKRNTIRRLSCCAEIMADDFYLLSKQQDEIEELKDALAEERVTTGLQKDQLVAAEHTIEELEDEVLELKKRLEEKEDAEIQEHVDAVWADHFDLVAYIEAHQELSQRIDGAGVRTAALTSHIRAELEEIESAPHDLSEWIDVIILALDGAWRAGHSPAEIVKGLADKQQINSERSWPDPQSQREDEPVEHIRELEVGAGC